MLAAVSAVRQTAQIVSTQRKLWVPFLATAVLEIILLGLVWLAPHPPFSNLLAPPIRYFFGDRVLHYPWHLWFLYHIMEHAHLIASTLLGAFLTGAACAMVQQRYEGKAMSLREVLVSRQVRYGTILLLWIVQWGLAKGVMEGLGRIAPKAAWMAWIAIGSAVLLQALLIYAIPAAVFNRSSWWRALGQSLRETAKHPLSTLAFVGVPSAALIAFAVFVPSARLLQWMSQTAPEIALAAVAARLALWTAVDAVMTVGVAHLWWCHRATQGAATSGPWAMGHEAVGSSHAPRPTPHAPTIVLLVLSLVIAASGCSDSYSGERLFWKAQQASAPIAKDASKATPEQFEQSRRAFQQVIDKSPGTMWAARAQVAIGSLRSLQKDYAGAREAYALMFQNYNQYKDLVLNARVATAKTYEEEKNWPEAVRIYREIEEYHPWSQIGLEAPLYVAAGYQKEGDTGEATRQYERAVKLYSKLIVDAPNPNSAAQVKGYLAQAYQRLGRWDEAIATLQELLQAPEGVNRPLTLLMLGSIYQTKLNDPDKAEAVYTKLLEESPDSPLAKLAKVQLESMGKLPASDPALPTR
jgi:tetratricopeptide (TPR) repeat protein